MRYFLFAIFSLPFLMTATGVGKDTSPATKPGARIKAKISAPILSSVSLADPATNNSKVTYQKRVSVTLSYTGSANEYRLGESSRWGNSRWYPYSPGQRISYTFRSPNDGTRRMYAQLRTGKNDAYASATRSAAISYRAPPVVSQFSFASGNAELTKRDVEVQWQLSGVVSHYRVSEQSNMSGVSWVASTAVSGSRVVNLEPGAGGTRAVHLEVRRDQGPIVRAQTSAYLKVGVCPIGHQGRECSGAGRCDFSGKCVCNPDIRGSTCSEISQRCYGAAGNNCGPADGLRGPQNLGVCTQTPLGTTSCAINAGSWAHDECCIRYRFGGPNNQQGSCTAIGMGPPPYVCQSELAKAVDHLTENYLTWIRHDIDRSKANSTTEIEMPVVHADYCNPPGGSLLCSDQQYCCSGSAVPALVQPNNNPRGLVCVCN